MNGNIYIHMLLEEGACMCVHQKQCYWSVVGGAVNRAVGLTVQIMLSLMA
jgi:hypothetical protein